MAVYRVTFPTTNPRTKEPFWCFAEFIGMDDLESIVDALNEGYMLIAHALRTKPRQDEEGRFYEVTGRQARAITRLGVGIVETLPPSYRFIEYEDG